LGAGALAQDDATMTVLIRTAADIVEAYRRRIAELGIAHSTVDAISGLPDGYTSKLLAPVPMKTMSRAAIELLNGALAIGFVVAVDDVQAKRVQGRWTQRKRPLRNRSASTSASMPLEIPITPELQAKLTLMEHMKKIASAGGKRRAQTMKKRARQRAAAHAARIRWSKRDAAHA
jgi:hypothetical protein